MAVAAPKAPPAATARQDRPLLRRGLSFEGKMLAPALAVLAAVSIFPFIYIIIMSLSQVRLIGGISFSWAGLDNWTRLFGDGAVRFIKQSIDSDQSTDHCAFPAATGNFTFQNLIHPADGNAVTIP